MTGWAGEKRRSDRTLVPRPRKRRFRMREITQLYLSPLRKTISVGGFPPLRPLPSLRQLVSKWSLLTKTQIKGYYLRQIQGQTLDILWVFVLSRICTTANLSNHMMPGLQIQPHDDFITQWVFSFLPLQPSRILSTDSHPATGRDYGSPHIVGFFFFTTNHTSLIRSTRWGSPFRPPAWAK